jgi:RNA polymerase sigma factor (sigma-70 family)
MERYVVPSDAEVIAVSLSDPAEFGRLIRAHSGRVVKYLHRRAGPVVAEDLAAETFLRAFRFRAGYEATSDTALPWLFAIATNVLRDHARSEQRRTEALGQLAGRAVYDRGGQERVDDSLEAAATLQQLAHGFAALSDHGRDVLALVAVEGLTYEEASVALGVPIGTVRSRLSRTRVDLRR